MILHNTFNKNKRYQKELCEACLYGLDIPEHDVGWGANCINYKQSYRMIVCDSPFLGPRDIKQINHARVGLDHHLEGLGYFNNQDKPSDRAEMFMSLFNFSIKPYYLNFKGHILLVVDRSGLYTSLGYDPTKWINDTIQTIRTHTDRDIEVRFKNTDVGFARSIKNDIINNYKNVFVTIPDKMMDVYDDYKDYFCVVVFTSNLAVSAAINGCPVFVTNRNSWASRVGNNINNINEPKLIDRTQWFYNLSYSIWSFDEIANGTVARHLNLKEE